ncbi:hypothetical protein Flav3CDRAFT_0314 [Flavobacteria bacterium MS024-3C]|jgi:hypothetical protein|nr:hypothetical protein Flav3CDRAFT_0314 [Flavobacteria bacterium MS024-3C]|tara:strand:+ start:162 stop:296 length:135 start_codon:yes stop_codon:yes gene_type:complete
MKRLSPDLYTGILTRVETPLNKKAIPSLGMAFLLLRYTGLFNLK